MLNNQRVTTKILQLPLPPPAGRGRPAARRELSGWQCAVAQRCGAGDPAEEGMVVKTMAFLMGN